MGYDDFCCVMAFGSFASHYSIVQLFIFNEMNNDGNIAAHLSVGQKSMVNKTSLVSQEFFLAVSENDLC